MPGDDRIVYHVTHRPDGRWQGKRVGAERAAHVTDTKQEAIDRTVELARKSALGQVVIHTQDGRIESERTYGDDPYPPKG
ncbi:MAG: DUF2188 domain-containing protein [bacterium]|nr:DUF2188 domain-containing protein [Myxococcales bacterium]MCB9553063.1 DUF2188 domain-containing protein [Myxococcales bacterium]